MNASISTLVQIKSADDLGTWLERWETNLNNRCVRRGSFQHSYLRVQHGYASIMLHGAKFARLKQGYNKPEYYYELHQVTQDIVNMVQELLQYISSCGTYSNVFRGAPTYEGLLLTYTIILGIQVLATDPASGEMLTLLQIVSLVMPILEQHPCQAFSRVVHSLVERVSSIKHSGAPKLSGPSDQGFPDFLDFPDFPDFHSLLHDGDWMADFTEPITYQM